MTAWEAIIYRLIIWNIDLTLVDVARVSRDAYAAAFERVTGRRLIALPQLVDASDSEIFFGALALNPPLPGTDEPPGEKLLARYFAELEEAFYARSNLLTIQGRLLPGAREALAAAAALPGVVQTVLTGTIKANAIEKLCAFDLDRYLDLSIGGFGSDAYPRGTLILRMLTLAEDRYGSQPAPGDVVYLADSTRDVAAAKVGGVRSIGVASGRSTARELHDAGADLVISDLADTKRLVMAIAS